MNKNFSLKLALNNLKNHRKFYLPFFLAQVGIIAMFYIITYLASSRDISDMSASLAMIMGMGVGIMAIFSFIFLFYTNSFLMKQRKKEIGLYNILGMEKRHIGRILILENFLVYLCSLIIGLLCGILFSKLILLAVSRIFGMAPPFGITVSSTGVVWTAVLFGALFLLTTVVNQMNIRLSKPVELLSGGNVGEKEPKAKWFIALLGFVCLGAGYYIANTVEEPLEALLWFFVAVALVIVGTYCLFTAGSIAVLKALRKNKKFYYKPGNFTAVSGMIYRMKQNAVGLANICILSTMVLVMVSGTVSLFFGTEDTINNMAPGDLNVTAYSHTTEMEESKVEEKAAETAEKHGLALKDFEKVTHLPVVAVEGTEGDYQFVVKNRAKVSDIRGFDFITAETYNAMTGENLQLAPGEAAVNSREDEIEGTFTVGDCRFTVKASLDDYMEAAELAAGLNEVYYVVVSDDSVLQKLYDKQAAEYKDRKSWITHRMSVYLSGSKEAIEAKSSEMQEELYGELGVKIGMKFEMLSIQARSEVESSFGELVGSFLFLGIFLGIVFTFAAALIIYYKQISEGYYDKGKFEIMQKVGMSRGEVKKTIRKQVLMVFFIPLVMAGIHIAAAFQMITNLLLVFSMTNVTLFAICTIATFLIFAVIYALVYAVTAREYYKIVG